MLLSADFFIFKIKLFLKKIFRKRIRVSNSLGPDEGRGLTGPDLGLNCLAKKNQQTTKWSLVWKE